MPNRLRISLVIPAYNEESYLTDCLRSALAQRLPFHEVIVVDNNSTDRTAEIAASFPGVKLLQEPRQGVVYARNRGFDSARGDIIGRVDADTRLPADWTEQLTAAFRDADTAAITGKVSYYETSFARSLSFVDNLLRWGVAHLLGKHMALQGANMAFRRSVWREIRSSICNQAGIHEDFDLAIHATQHGFRPRYLPQLQASIACRQAAGPWRQFASYYWHCPKTYLQHDIQRGYWLVPVAFGMVCAYPALHLFYKGKSLQAEFEPLALRVNPATFVD